MDQQTLFDDSEAWRIEGECVKLINRFAHFIDNRRYDELLGLMTSDCIIEWPGNKMRGAELVEMLKESPEDVVSMHVITVPLFGSVTRDEADCISYLTFYQAPMSEDGVGILAGAAVLAEYHDKFRRSEAGWRISGRVVKPKMARA
ncbi:nuclear transport factor 2 family protein [Sphingobium phenoxybenzoativorans]|uniref:nuclear transport factor 2 family protein n=1 Tax=Sphingobium phenoxybenzoativorans TaxID=1592790 RepID=UPI000871EF50|nr:nuclear transport factor 2 family protein [Sphingobium phenoxybenzoativorans]